MEDNNDKSRVSRRVTLKRLGVAGGAAAFGGAGLLFTSGGAAAAEVEANNLTSEEAVEITSDGGDVTDFSLGEATAFDLGWEGFDADIDTVTFTLEARRSQFGTGESEEEINLGADDSSPVQLFEDSLEPLEKGRSGNVTYSSGDLGIDFPFHIISGSDSGANVVGALGDGNLDADSLSLDSDGDTKINEIEFTLTAVVAAGEQSVQVSQTGTMDVIVGNIQSAADTGGTISGSGSGI